MSTGVFHSNGYTNDLWNGRNAAWRRQLRVAALCPPHLHVPFVEAEHPFVKDPTVSPFHTAPTSLRWKQRDLWEESAFYGFLQSIPRPLHFRWFRPMGHHPSCLPNEDWCVTGPGMRDYFASCRARQQGSNMFFPDLESLGKVCQLDRHHVQQRRRLRAAMRRLAAPRPAGESEGATAPCPCCLHSQALRARQDGEVLPCGVCWWSSEKEQHENVEEALRSAPPSSAGQHLRASEVADAHLHLAFLFLAQAQSDGAESRDIAAAATGRAKYHLEIATQCGEPRARFLAHWILAKLHPAGSVDAQCEYRFASAAATSPECQAWIDQDQGAARMANEASAKAVPALSAAAPRAAADGLHWRGPAETRPGQTGVSKEDD